MDQAVATLDEWIAAIVRAYEARRDRPEPAARASTPLKRRHPPEVPEERRADDRV